MPPNTLRLICEKTGTAIPIVFAFVADPVGSGIVASLLNTAAFAASRGGVWQKARPMAHILVVDDSADARELIAAILSAEGYQVSIAADGKEALDRYIELRPDAVVTDIFMPGMDGIELARTLRRDFWDARIVAISAGWNLPNLEINDTLLDRDLLALAKAAGADCALGKPLDPKELVSVVKKLLSRKLPEVRPPSAWLDRVVQKPIQFFELCASIGTHVTPSGGFPSTGKAGETS